MAVEADMPMMDARSRLAAGPQNKVNRFLSLIFVSTPVHHALMQSPCSLQFQGLILNASQFVFCVLHLVTFCIQLRLKPIRTA